MANLLGDVWLSQQCENKDEIETGDAKPGLDDESSRQVKGLFPNGLDLSALSLFPQVLDVVLYGKTEPRSKRKMGHFVLSGRDRDGGTLQDLARAADEFRWTLSKSSSHSG